MSESRRLAVFVFGLSLGLMLYELCLTRVLSTLFYHHTAFLSLSLAMLGLGAGALAVRLSARAGRLDPGVPGVLAGLATTLLPACFPLVQVEQDDLFDIGGAGLPMALGLSIALSVLPFLFGGAALALAFRLGRERIARLYAADLFGAALATLAMVPAMELLGGPASLPAAGSLAAAAALFAPGGGRRFATSALVILLALAGLARETSLFRLELTLREEDRNEETGARPEALFEKWNAFSRVTVLEDAGWDRGLSQTAMERLGGVMPEQREALIDINAFAPIVRFDGDLAAVAHLRDVVSNIGYRLLGPRPRVAIIGPGGGKDVLGALLFSPREVIGIEVNEILVDDLVKDRFRDFAGDIYRREGVRILVGDGRSEMHRVEGRFDIIVANSVATWAAQSTGAMTLSEQHLFTTEAFRLYRDKLADRGILSVSLWDEAEHSVPMRLAATWLAAARASGEMDAAAEIAVIGNRWGEGRWFSTVLMRKGGLRFDERERLAEIARELGFDLIHIRGIEPDAPTDFAEFLAAPETFARGSRHELGPATDDRPFVFYTLRPADALAFWRGMERSDNAAFTSLALSLVSVTLLVGLLVLAPLVRLRRRSGEAGLSGREMLYFGALGYGFMAIEIAVIQRFQLLLGHPTRSLTVALFALLLASGLGSRLAAHRPRVRPVLGLLVLVLGLVQFLGAPLLEETALGLPLLWRIAATLALLSPAGVLMGMPMPLGLARLAPRGGDAIPWAFGLNCATGVLASVAAVLTAVLFGFAAAFGTGLTAYLIALATAPENGGKG